MAKIVRTQHIPGNCHQNVYMTLYDQKDQPHFTQPVIVLSQEGYCPSYVNARTTTPVGFVADITFETLEKLVKDPKIIYIDCSNKIELEN